MLQAGVLIPRPAARPPGLDRLVEPFHVADEIRYLFRAGINHSLATVAGEIERPLLQGLQLPRSVLEGNAVFAVRAFGKKSIVSDIPTDGSPTVPLAQSFTARIFCATPDAAFTCNSRSTW